MAYIFETKHFIVESHDAPEVDRLEGGHITISPKVLVEDRTHLTPQQAIELMRLTMVTGKALKAAMHDIGLEIGRINYQDNGNWKPQLHIHLYGRAKTATMQQYGDPIIPGHKPEYSALTNNDINRISHYIYGLLSSDEYSDRVWGLTEYL